jgi:hypothetical protein
VLSCSSFQVKVRIYVISALCISYGFAHAEKAADINEISTLVKQIEDQPNARTQYDLGEKLENILRKSSDSQEISENVILDITNLLSNKNVEIWAALALGDIGPRASSAIPQLERALKEAEAEQKLIIVGPDLSAADVLRGVLSKITGIPYEAVH